MKEVRAVRHELVAEVWRSGFLESVHQGSVAALDGEKVVLAIGSPGEPLFPRSANKPLQALAMLRHGLPLDGELLALACASHSGEEFHVKGVLRILEGAGLTAEALQCTPDLPLSDDARRERIVAGQRPAPLFMNCSGKHAAMLATCVVNDWPIADYRDPAHPLQRAIQDTLVSVSGEPVAATGVDGCGAPVFALSLLAVARAFRRLAGSPPGSRERRVADAMRTYPEYVGGTGRDVTTLMRQVPGLLAKDGAEGVYAAGLPDGRAVALKIGDGTQRARPVVMSAALRRLGVDVPGSLATAPVLGRGEPVGEVRPAGLLTPSGDEPR